MKDITQMKVSTLDGELAGFPGRKIIGIILPVSVDIMLFEDDGGYHGCSIVMADIEAHSLLNGLKKQLTPIR